MKNIIGTLVLVTFLAIPILSVAREKPCQQVNVYGVRTGFEVFETEGDGNCDTKIITKVKCSAHNTTICYILDIQVDDGKLMRLEYDNLGAWQVYDVDWPNVVFIDRINYYWMPAENAMFSEFHIGLITVPVIGG